MTKPKKAKKKEVAAEPPMLKRRGRPATPPEDRVMYHPYGVNVPYDLWLKFKEVCDQQRKTYSEVGVELIRDAITRFETKGA